MKKENYSNCIAVIGEEGTGKSILSYDFALKFKKPILIVEPDAYAVTFQKFRFVKNFPKDLPTKKYETKRTLFEDKNTFLQIHQNVKNSVVIFDDVNLYDLEIQRIPQPLKILIGRRRHTQNDYIFNLHGYKSFPKGAFEFVNIYLLKKCRDNYEIIKGHLNEQNFNELVKAQKKANKLSSTREYVYKEL
jgi:hypothetical protein